MYLDSYEKIERRLEIVKLLNKATELNQQAIELILSNDTKFDELRKESQKYIIRRH